jgi:hypothetical protein
MPCLVVVVSSSFGRPRGGTAVQSSQRVRRGRIVCAELSVLGPTVPHMDSTDRQPTLRVVADEPAAPEETREDYWAQVQALRADLRRLRPAN